MSGSSNAALPKKEADLFRNLIRLYEAKQYKKAIKSADAILKKFPNHGETLAMKGLTVNSMSNGKRGDEAHAMVKDALRYDMK
jgi:N-alpha-acetyltransferase 15/16, NatA auxiliary subunit